jgi:electron transfer flavoprotein alpha subunit
MAERSEGADPYALTAELAACARAISPDGQTGTVIAWTDPDAQDALDSLSRDTGCRVLVLSGEEPLAYSCEVFTRESAALARELGASVILVPHTPRGYDYAPRLAVRMGARCVTAVEEITWDGGSLRMIRSACFGKLRSSIDPGDGPLVLTVMPGSFRMDAAAADGIPMVERRVVSTLMEFTRSVSVSSAKGGTLDFSNADVIVSAGKGMQKRENMDLVRALARRFPRSAVGGSRIACDLGWLDYDAQVGITGKTVAPRLYIACGISGALQHVSAIRGSRHIVAVNRDPSAAIFKEADMGVVEDALTFIPLLIAEIDSRKGEVP